MGDGLDGEGVGEERMVSPAGMSWLRGLVWVCGAALVFCLASDGARDWFAPEQIPD